ncbi:hypothetical protein [Snodgrassella alvi]|jgi:hypothetical protein|uniref:Uncharacterized protein n=2 Tax=Snodgrassella alvi TaxID=1196083 RepID=A0A855FR29_9NEIS|nr:hypothetical protein [Snodgrassella alvi]PIT08230.1 hypothetical protein BGI30_08975 [Snodgrassella alvi]PIT26701.1 hypothetical protein BGI37_05065 [Snodgrassella alvi]PIT58830.1 hypothetical protein BHC59_01340 [Snodgrassella alvi]PIT60215.1 hypothetical protein BHC57_04840 [Snodgrassella alvi]
MTNTTNTKEAFVNAARQYMRKAVISEVPNIAPYEGLYVKMFNVLEMTNFFQRCEEFESSYDDGLNGVREKALMIVDQNGKPMFYPDSREDLEFLAELPSKVLSVVQEQFFLINGDEGLKKQSQDAKSS